MKTFVDVNWLFELLKLLITYICSIYLNNTIIVYLVYLGVSFENFSIMTDQLWAYTFKRNPLQAFKTSMKWKDSQSLFRFEPIHELEIGPTLASHLRFWETCLDATFTSVPSSQNHLLEKHHYHEAEKYNTRSLLTYALRTGHQYNVVCLGIYLLHSANSFPSRESETCPAHLSSCFFLLLWKGTQILHSGQSTSLFFFFFWNLSLLV